MTYQQTINRCAPEVGRVTPCAPPIWISNQVGRALPCAPVWIGIQSSMFSVRCSDFGLRIAAFRGLRSTSPQTPSMLFLQKNVRLVALWCASVRLGALRLFPSQKVFQNPCYNHPMQNEASAIYKSDRSARPQSSRRPGNGSPGKWSGRSAGILPALGISGAAILFDQKHANYFSCSHFHQMRPFAQNSAFPKHGLKRSQKVLKGLKKSHFTQGLQTPRPSTLSRTIHPSVRFGFRTSDFRHSRFRSSPENNLSLGWRIWRLLRRGLW